MLSLRTSSTSRSISSDVPGAGAVSVDDRPYGLERDQRPEPAAAVALVAADAFRMWRADAGGDSVDLSGSYLEGLP